MRGLNHLVLAGHDLDRMRDAYVEFGFTITAKGQHPFGTGNTIIQMPGTYIELLAVTRPADVVEHTPRHFSFSAFNRDYLMRHEGFSMVVFDSHDARKDIEDWKLKKLRTFEPLDFSRKAVMSDGRQVTVAFSLAQTLLPSAPWLGHFACQHHLPEYYEQPQFLKHPNGSRRVKEVWISGPRALDVLSHFEILTSVAPLAVNREQFVFHTQRGSLVVATEAAFERAFGCPAQHTEDGPHLGGLTIECENPDTIPSNLAAWHGDRLIVGPDRNFGTAMAFVPSFQPTLAPGAR